MFEPSGNPDQRELSLESGPRKGTEASSSVTRTVTAYSKDYMCHKTVCLVLDVRRLRSVVTQLFPSESQARPVFPGTPGPARPIQKGTGMAPVAVRK